MEEKMGLDRYFARTQLAKAGIDSVEKEECLAKLMKGSREGNLCLSLDQIGYAIRDLPASLVSEGKESFPKTPIVFQEKRYYLQKNWVYETHILQQIESLRKRGSPSYFNCQLFNEGVAALVHSGQLLEQQAVAIRSALNHSLTLICGGPGTGKTYTISHLVQLLFQSRIISEKKQYRVCLSAPTGKASSHLMGAFASRGLSDKDLHVEASTLHRLLRLQPGESDLFSGRLIDADLVVVDEASMIDVPLLAHLLGSIGEETLLVLIGDPDQLPPIETTSLFSEMASAFGVQLETCMRTDDTHLRLCAETVKKGSADEFFKTLCSASNNIKRLDWSFDHSLPEKLYHKIDPLIFDTKPDPIECMKSYHRFRILNAVRQGPFGVDNLNRELLRMLKTKAQSKSWVVPILATVNDSYAGIYNGMSGILIGGIAYFPDPTSGIMRSFPIAPPYELGFCLSIHKSQGSEFNEVLALFPEGSENFGREAIYTALTRTKERLEIVGDEEILRRMIGTSFRKRSGLKERIERCHN